MNTLQQGCSSQVEITSGRYKPDCAYCKNRKAIIHRVDADPLVCIATCGSDSCCELAVESLKLKYQSMVDTGRQRKKAKKK